MKKQVIRQQDRILLIGEAEEMQLEYQAYQRFKLWLGQGAKVFAQVLEFQEMGRQACLTLELVQGQTLEELLQASRYEAATHATNKVLALLSEWRNLPTFGDYQNFIRELMESVESRMERLKSLNQAGDVAEFWDHVKGNIQIPEFQLHFCHRDLQTRNIILQPDGNIRLIDPRFALHGSRIDTPGHSLVDLVQLHVSLLYPKEEPTEEQMYYRSQLGQDVLFDHIKPLTGADHKPKLCHLINFHRYANTCYHKARSGRLLEGELMRQEARKHVRKLITGCWIRP